MITTSSQLVILMGLPGSGKSYVAAKLAEKRFVVVSGEDIARELFGTEQLSAKQYEQVYAAVRKRARKLLDEGSRVVIDGTNLKYKYRKQMYDECVEFTVGLLYLEVDRKMAMQRIQDRVRLGEGSGCDEQTFIEFEKQLEPPRSDEDFITLDSTDPELLGKTFLNVF